MPPISIVVCGVNLKIQNNTSFSGYSTFPMDVPRKIAPFLEDAQLSMSGPLPGSKQTHNRAELYAAYTAVSSAGIFMDEDVVPGLEKVVILSSSLYLIDGIGKNNVAEGYVHNWTRNGWKNVSGEYVQNQDLWEKLYKFVSLGGFQFEYIREDDPRRERCREIARYQADKALVRAGY